MTGRLEIGLHTAPFGISEEGVLINNQGAEEIGQYLGCSVEYATCRNGIHRLFIKAVPDAVATVLVFCGGEGQVYLQPNMVFPEKLIFPLTSVLHWAQHKINIVIVDQSYVLPWGWQKLIGTAKFGKVFRYILSSAKKTTEEQRAAKPELALANFLVDVQDIISFVRLKFSSQIFLAGHCSSAVLVSLFAEIYPDNLAGLILWSPFRPLKCDAVVDKSITIPVLVTQHCNDRCLNTSTTTSKMVANECSNGVYVELVGGTDQGHQDFSLGHHGYRDVEDSLVSVTAKFVHNVLN